MIEYAAEQIEKEYSKNKLRETRSGTEAKNCALHVIKMLQLLNKLFHSIKMAFPERKMRQLIEPNSRHYLPSNRGLNRMQLHTHTYSHEMRSKMVARDLSVQYKNKRKEKWKRQEDLVTLASRVCVYFFVVPIDFSMH